MIRNPVLPGFNPDPSFLRVGEDYYLATSTFEWYPGVCIYHSRDLANWELVARPLNRKALLDMRGDPDSCGVWAPCLSHDGDKFWLVYTDVKRLDGAFKDAHNYITCCDTVDGVWSDPWYVNSSGFDPSLFHDEDGRKWFVNMQWNHRGPGTGGNPAHASFDGILMQEWSPNAGLTGPVKQIYPGTDRGLTEAPHLFKRNGYYYLTTAEGGTGYNHAVTMARSRDIWGPYEDHPQKHVLSAAGSNGPVQRTGHGQYVETHWGDHYHSFLMGRPFHHNGRMYCPLGRETGLERVVWRDDWLWLEAGGLVARPEVPSPTGAVSAPRKPVRRALGGPLPIEFQWLRTPESDRIFREDADALTLIGRESIGSFFEQSLVARRQEDFVYTAETALDIAPETYQQAAGLVTYYNRHKFHAALVSDEPGLGRCLTLMSCPGDWPEQRLFWPADPLTLADGPVELRVEVDHAAQQFWVRQAGGDWVKFGPVLNAAVISDEGGRGEHASFTGAFVGMVAMDTSGRAKEARFTRFDYVPGDQA